MAAVPPEVRRRRDDLVRHAGAGATPADVVARAAARLRRLVPFDAAAWLGTDPGTGLPTSPVRVEGVEGITRAQCAEHWYRELLGEDVNPFHQLFGAPTPAAALRASVDDPDRSRRFRRFLRPLGFDDELRAVLRVGDAPWGTVTLWRRDGSPPFTSRDAALLASLSAPLGEALRAHARPSDEPGGVPAGGRPGLLVFDRHGELASIDDAARRWLAELPCDTAVDTAHGVQVPLWMLITVLRARTRRDGTGDGTARTRARTAGGRWLVCHASSLRRAGGEDGGTALVIEPAQPAAVAPLVAEALDLSEREQQVVSLVARGASTDDIAAELLLSPHTVRGHVKAIFAKAGVSSRGELTARLYADVAEPLHAPPAGR